MVATERVIVLMTRKEKAEIAKRAKAANLSMSAYMRRQALGSDEELFTELVDELRTSTDRARKALDSALARCEDSERNRHQRENEARRRAIAEFQGLDPTTLF